MGFKLPYRRATDLQLWPFLHFLPKHLPLFSVQSLGVSLLGALDGPRGALDGGGLRWSIRKTNADKETEHNSGIRVFMTFSGERCEYQP